MKRFIAVLLTAASIAALPGQAVAATDYSRERAHADTVFRLGAQRKEADEDNRQAQMASQRGDWAMTRDFAERSYRTEPTVVNEFNLATAYQRTGRPDLAVPLYIDLLDRGQNTPTRPLVPFDNVRWAPMQPTLAMEAAARLEKMGAPTAYAGGAKPYSSVVMK